MAKENNGTCGAQTEVYSRVTGFYRPVQQWNDGKQAEFRDRKKYDIGTIPRADRTAFKPVQ